MNQLNNQSPLDKKSILGIAICIFFFMAYQGYLTNKYPDYGKPSNPEPASNIVKEEKIVVKPAGPAEIKTAPGVATTDSYKLLSDADLTISTETNEYHFNQKTGALKSVILKNYSQQQGKESPVNLLTNELIFQGSLDSKIKTPAYGFDAERKGQTITFSRKEDNWRISQTYDFSSNDYQGLVTVKFENVSDKGQQLFGNILFKENIVLPETAGGLLSYSFVNYQIDYSVDGVFENEDLRSYCKDPEEAAINLSNEKLDFFGTDHHYFLKAFLPQTGKMSLLVERDPTNAGMSPEKACALVGTISEDFGRIKPGQTAEFKFKTFMGPKEPEFLAAADQSLVYSIDMFFGFIARPLANGIHWVYTKVGNYGIAIIILTLILKIIFFPLTKQAQVSMKKMQKLQPEMKKIREKNADDPRKQQQELMQFMSRHKVNPAKGCLPILPQIPVFIAFYQCLAYSIDLRHAPFYGWITDLSVADPYYISPVIMGIAMFVQQKLTPTATMDKAQERVMMMMPLIFTFMMVSLPAGLVLYMIVNSVVTIVQQQYLNRKLA